MSESTPQRMGLLEVISSGLKFIFTNPIPVVWANFIGRESHPFLQFAKYGICGVGSVIVHNIVFVIIASGDTFPARTDSIVDGQPISDSLRFKNAVICNVFGFFVSNFFAYATNAFWVFERGRHGFWGEFGRFTGVAFLAFLVGTVGLYAIELYGLPTIWAQLLFVLTAALVNFVCRKFLIFLK